MSRDLGLPGDVRPGQFPRWTRHLVEIARNGPLRDNPVWPLIAGTQNQDRLLDCEIATRFPTAAPNRPTLWALLRDRPSPADSKQSTLPCF